MIKNIIFDLGNVLIYFDYNRFFAACGFAPEERDVDEALPVILRFDAGLIGRDEFYLGMKKVFSFDLSPAEFEAAWCDNFWENTEMIDFAHELSRQYRIFILSNTDEIHFPYIWQKFPSLHVFRQNILLSYELQAVKPEKLIYRKALRKFDLIPAECIFIDDKKINVRVAQEIGLKAVWHADNKKTKEKIISMLDLKDMEKTICP